MRDWLALVLIRLAGRLTTHGDTYDHLQEARRRQVSWIDHGRKATR
jgi:hypothetical protein